MRTTVSIDDALLERAKRKASERGQTLGQYVEEAVRRDLVAQPRESSPIELPVFTRGTGLQAGIDPSSNRALHDALDAGGDLA